LKRWDPDRREILRLAELGLAGPAHEARNKLDPIDSLQGNAL
jgi:hypothetical protein